MSEKQANIVGNILIAIAMIVCLNSRVLADEMISTNGKNTRLAYFNCDVKGLVRGYKTITRSAIDVADKSPFDIIAISLKETNIDKLNESINFVRSSHKEFWPIVFFFKNWIEKKNMVLDIWNPKTISETAERVRTAISVSKKSGCNGIFFDLEIYGDRSNYRLSYLAKKNHKSNQLAIMQLRRIGKMLADLIQSEVGNKDFTIWFTFADFQHVMADGFMRSTNYIIESLLDRIVEKKYKFKVIDGGELSTGYAHLNSIKLGKRIALHKNNIRPWIEKFKPHFKVAGTMVLFEDWNNLGSWENLYKKNGKNILDITESESCDKTLSLLLENYDFVWVFWGGNPTFDLFDPDSAKIFIPMVKNALIRTMDIKLRKTP